MDDNEASPTSNSTSPTNKKTIVLGVVNASEIKCKVDRKRRWDQPPSEGESEGPPFKQLCDIVIEDFVEDKPLENNVRHSDKLENNSLEDIPLPPGVESSSDRLTAPSSPSEPVVIKEQIVVQTPSDVLNSLDINSSFPISSSFNELNYTEGNQRVTIEIETVEVTPSASDDEPKTSIQIIDPNSATVDSLSKSDDNLVKMDEANCNDDSGSGAPSPVDSEGGDVVGRSSIDVESAGNVDPAVMEVILGITPSKDTLPPQEIPSQEPSVNTSPSRVGNVDEHNKNLISVEQSASAGELKLKLGHQLISDKNTSNKESSVSKIIGVKLKGLVDYDDDSDESSQLSDKIIAVEPAGIKKAVEEISSVCENSLDSKEEEFHDCVEQQTTDESNYDSSSLNNLQVASAQDSDDLINNNPLETDDVNCDEVGPNLDSKSCEVASNITLNTDVCTKPESGISNENNPLKENQIVPASLSDPSIHDKSLYQKDGDSVISEKCNSLDVVANNPAASSSHLEKSTEVVSSTENDLNCDKSSENLEFHQPSNNNSGATTETNNVITSDKSSEEISTDAMLTDEEMKPDLIPEESHNTTVNEPCKDESTEGSVGSPVSTSQIQDINSAGKSAEQLQESEEIDCLQSSCENRVHNESHIVDPCIAEEVNAGIVTSNLKNEECLRTNEAETESEKEILSSDHLDSLQKSEESSCRDIEEKDRDEELVIETRPCQESMQLSSVVESDRKEETVECSDVRTSEEKACPSETDDAEMIVNRPEEITNTLSSSSIQVKDCEKSLTICDISSTVKSEEIANILSSSSVEVKDCEKSLTVCDDVSTVIHDEVSDTLSNLSEGVKDCETSVSVCDSTSTANLEETVPLSSSSKENNDTENSVSIADSALPVKLDVIPDTLSSISKEVKDVDDSVVANDSVLKEKPEETAKRKSNSSLEVKDTEDPMVVCDNVLLDKPEETNESESSSIIKVKGTEGSVLVCDNVLTEMSEETSKSIPKSIIEVKEKEAEGSTSVCGNIKMEKPEETTEPIPKLSIEVKDTVDSVAACNSLLTVMSEETIEPLPGLSEEVKCPEDSVLVCDSELTVKFEETTKSEVSSNLEVTDPKDSELVCDNMLTSEKVEDSSYSCDKETKKEMNDSLANDNKEKHEESAEALMPDNPTLICDTTEEEGTKGISCVDTKTKDDQDLSITSNEGVLEENVSQKTCSSDVEESDAQRKKLALNISDSSDKASKIDVIVNDVGPSETIKTLDVDAVREEEPVVNDVKDLPDKDDHFKIAAKIEKKESLVSKETVQSRSAEGSVKGHEKKAKVPSDAVIHSAEKNNSSEKLVPIVEKSSGNGVVQGVNPNIIEDKLKCSEDIADDISAEDISKSDVTTVVDVKEVENSRLSKTVLKGFVEIPQVMASENSMQSSTDLNMECESADTQQSVESINESLSVLIKEDAHSHLNSNAIIDISSDSTSSDKKDKTCLSFNLSSINNKASEKVKQKVDDKICTVISSDDDASSVEYLNASKTIIDSKKEKCEVNATPVAKEDKILDADINASRINSDVIVVPDSDSSNSKSENISKKRPLKKVRDPEKTVSLSVKSNDTSVANPKLSSSKDGSLETQSVTKNVTSCSDLMEVCDASAELSSTNVDALGESDSKDEESSKVEPITLRIFKDNNSLHSESGAGSSPKRPRLDDSPKQLEFTLKISKDASTNIPKATMSPKRTQSPQRHPDPTPKISSEVSITPIIYSPQTDKKTVKRATRHGKPSVNDTSGVELSVDTTSKPVSENADVRVPNVGSLINNIPCKTDLSNFNSVRISESGEETSIIEIKDETPMETPVNISVRGGKRGRRDGTPVSTPRRRGRPPKRPMDVMLSHAMMGSGTPGALSTDSTSDASATDTPSGRPVRECRDRTRPIIFRQRRPRGGGNSMGRGRGGGGRGGARIPIVPGREALSLREQEELDRIEARNQQIRLEKLAKREAKLAKKAKRAPSPVEEPPPPPPPRELTDEEKAELAARKEAEEKARAEAAAAAALEAERLAQEAAAAKEAEKLAKIMARRERLRELHRMKREKILAKKAAKKIKDEERRKRKAAEKAAEQAAALQSMYEDETRMSAPDGSLRPLYGEDSSNRNKTGRMEINLSESKEVSVEQLAEYQWESGDLYMIQEQVAEYLGVKSFKRKYPDLRRRAVDAEERKYLEETGLVPKSLCDLGITAVSSAEVLDVMFQDFPNKYEEVRKYLREKQMREISSKQRALSLYSKQSDKAKADLRDQAMECAASWNSHLNKERREERKSSMDLQSFIIHYPLSKREVMKRPTSGPGHFPVAVLPGQFCDYHKRYTSNELMYYPLNTVLYGPLKPNERHILQSDASLSESESSSSDESSSSSEDSDSESEGDEDTKCKVCNSSRSSRLDEGTTPTSSSQQRPPLNSPEIFLPCTKCKLLSHPWCCKITVAMLPHVRKYNWLCTTCKMCVKCNSSENQDKMRLCDLCDRGFHIACLDSRKLVPDGKRWHCAICSFCWSCGAREPGGPSNQWLHEFIKDENGEKVYQRSLCAACCANVGREAAAAVAATAAAARASAASTSSIGTTMAGTSGMMASPSNPLSPVRGYQVIQTKDGNQVRVAMSRGIGPMLVRSPGVMGGPRGATAETLVVRSPRGHHQGTETMVIRSPTGMPRPRQNIILSPNNRIDMVSHLSTININGATTNAKK